MSITNIFFLSLMSLFLSSLKKYINCLFDSFILYFNLALFFFLEKRCPKMNVETNSNGSPVWHGLDVGPILNLVLPRTNFLDALITSKLWNIHFLSKGPFTNYVVTILQFLDQPTKGLSILFNHLIDMRTTVNLSISCRKNLFLFKFSNKNK